MIDPRAVATLGIGYQPSILARIGFWPVSETVSEFFESRTRLIRARVLLIARASLETMLAASARIVDASADDRNVTVESIA